MKNLELLYRPTVFSRTLLAEMWDDLSVMERVDLLLDSTKFKGYMGDELQMKALSDSNPVVRMLAVQCSYVSEDEEPDLHTQLKADPSPFVRAVVNGANSFFVTPDVFKRWTHIERLTHIALSDYFGGESFAEFITSGLQSQTLPEREAAELVCEFVHNPKINKSLTREPADGMDWHTIGHDFKAVWNLTTCTPWTVHSSIARDYPLEIGDNSVTVEMINRTHDGVIKSLIWRQYKPLLEFIENKPKRFSEGVLKEVELAGQ